MKDKTASVIDYWSGLAEVQVPVGQWVEGQGGSGRGVVECGRRMRKGWGVSVKIKKKEF